MSINIIFVILTSILVIAALVYIIGTKKGKPKSVSVPTSIPPSSLSIDKEDEEDEEL